MLRRLNSSALLAVMAAVVLTLGSGGCGGNGDTGTNQSLGGAYGGLVFGNENDAWIRCESQDGMETCEGFIFKRNGDLYTVGGGILLNDGQQLWGIRKIATYTVSGETISMCLAHLDGVCMENRDINFSITDNGNTLLLGHDVDDSSRLFGTFTRRENLNIMIIRTD